MAQAQANVVSLGYIAEATPGVTPTTGPMTLLRYKTADFNANISNTTSQEIRSDRATSDLVRTSGSSEGSIAFELSAVEYEPFMESALGGTWSASANLTEAITYSTGTLTFTASDTTGIIPGGFVKVAGFTTPNLSNNGVFKVASVTANTDFTIEAGWTNAGMTDSTSPASGTVKGKNLRNGAVKKTFSMERNFSDLTDEWMNHTGMMVGSMVINAASEAIVDGTLSFQGQQTAIATATLGSGTATSVTSNPIMSAVANVGSIYENDTLVSGVFFKSINLTTNNNLRNLTAISNLYPIDINMGSFAAEFAVETYFSDTSLLAKYINGTPSALAYQFDDDNGNTIVIEAPNVKYSAGTLNGVALNSDVMVSLTATALNDPTNNYMLQISYLPA